MPVDPTPEALARDPEVQIALDEYFGATLRHCNADDRTDLVNRKEKLLELAADIDKAAVNAVSTILARYRATRATTGPVLSFEAARAEAIARSAAGYDTEAHAYDAALEQQAAERVGVLEARIKELEGVSCDYCGRALKRISEAPR